MNPWDSVESVATHLQQQYTRPEWSEIKFGLTFFKAARCGGRARMRYNRVFRLYLEVDGGKVFLRSRVQLLAVALISTAAAFGQTKLLRFPDIHAERVVFTYGGDLWTAPCDWRHGDPSNVAPRTRIVCKVFA